MLLRIATTNDTSGNPRRGWLSVTAAGQPLRWIEEGYLGSAAIRGIDDGETMTIHVTPAEFKRLSNIGKMAAITEDSEPVTL
jgi:hypothetical protein